MGSRERYQNYFEQNPGTYFRSTGWLERGRGLAAAEPSHRWASMNRLDCA